MISLTFNNFPPNYEQYCFRRHILIEGIEFGKAHALFQQKNANVGLKMSKIKIKLSIIRPPAGGCYSLHIMV
jgi:hypothetical protein